MVPLLYALNYTNLLLKYRYPYCEEDIDLFHFSQVLVSILWRRYIYLFHFTQISVSILWTITIGRIYYHFEDPLKCLTL